MSNRPRAEEILNSLDGLQPASPRPFFTGRVMFRLQTEWRSALPPLSPRFKWVLAGAALLIAFNILLLLGKFQTSAHPALTEWKNSTPDWLVDYTENPESSLSQVSNK